MSDNLTALRACAEQLEETYFFGHHADRVRKAADRIEELEAALRSKNTLLLQKVNEYTELDREVKRLKQKRAQAELADRIEQLEADNQSLRDISGRAIKDDTANLDKAEVDNK